jgi:hypothetical protein
MNAPVSNITMSSCIINKHQALRALLLTLLAFTLPSICVPPTCDVATISSLQTAVHDTDAALTALATCFDYLDNQSFNHLAPDNSDYCSDDASQDPALRLANLELRLAALEGNTNTFCCSATECSANCPEATGLMGITCSADCKTPHQQSLLTTLDVVPRIQNVANRILAVKPLVETGSCQADDAPESTPAASPAPSTHASSTPVVSTPAAQSTSTTTTSSSDNSGNLP